MVLRIYFINHKQINIKSYTYGTVLLKNITVVIGTLFGCNDP